MSENLNINEILKLVQDANNEDVIEIYVPSLKKSINAHPMTASHLKDIIKISLEGVFASNMFDQTMYVIIKEIFKDSDFDSSKANLYDKISILLQLRFHNVSETVSVNMINKSSDEQKTVDVDLKKVLNKIKKQIISFDDVVVSDGAYSTVLNYPVMDIGYLFDRHFEKQHVKTTDESDKQALKKLAGPIFLNEITRYIKDLKVKDNDFGFSRLDPQQRINVVNSIKGKITTKIINEIDQKFGQPLTELVKQSKIIDGEKYEGSIEIDASLFAS